MNIQHKFEVKKYSDPDQYEITFYDLGTREAVEFTRLLNSLPVVDKHCDTHIYTVNINDESLCILLNSVFTDAYERGREAVLACMKESMGFSRYGE